MSPPTWLKTPQERSASFVSLSSSLDNSVTDGAPGSPASRGQNINSAISVGLQIPVVPEKKEKNRSQPPGSKSEVEELAIDKDASVNSGERSKQAPGSEPPQTPEERQKQVAQQG